MAFENCIDEIIQAGNGKVDEKEARRILGQVFDRATRHEKDGLSRSDAALKAARELGDEERIAAAIEKRNTIINKMRQQGLQERKAIGSRESLVVRETLNAIDAEGHANSGKLLGGMLGELRAAGLLKAVLRRNKDFEGDIAREMWRLNDPQAGLGTGNKIAEQVAVILNRYQEVARGMENKAGAYIGKTDHYVTRQSHDMEKIRGVGGEEGFREWRDFIEPKLDERTFEGVEDPDKFLRDVYQALSTGQHERSNGADWLAGFTGPGNLAKRLSQERKLHFKSADDWNSYNQRFGRGNVVDSVMRGLEHAGRNTALMRTLGTNPETMFKSWIDDLAEKAGERRDYKTADAVRSEFNERILDTVTGKAGIPANMSLAQVGRYIRTAESLAKLGGVVLSSLPDVAVSASTLRWNGVPLLEAYARTILSPLRGRRSGETRQIADMLGVGIDGMVGRLLSRFYADNGAVGHGSKLIETFHRANLLSFWTDSLKTGVGLMLSSNLARNTGREFAALPQRLQITLRKYGIQAPEWEAVRRAETRAADGRDYLMPGSMADLPDEAVAHLGKQGTPAELARIRDDLQAKVGAYINDQSREALTESTAFGRTVGTWGTRSGTLAGEAIRLISQFKQYPATYIERHLGREFTRDGVDVAGVAHLIVATTLLGYVSMTAKELVKGRNPREPEKVGDYGKLVAAAMTQGGGLGIYGDFLFGNANRLGGGFVGSLTGPALGSLEDVHNLVTAIRDGSDARSRGQIAASEGIRTVTNNAPFMNLFYTRAALDYFILHRLQEAVNPGYLRRYEDKVKKDNAQTFWLRPTATPYQTWR